VEKINSLTGMADLIGQKDKKSNQSDSIFQVEKKLIEIFENYSLQEIRTPALESEKLFNRSVGDSSDIVNKELYTFKDKNEKKISLRPEGTAGVVRSIIEKKLDNESHRFWYLGPMWRYERPQKGRYRQFYQAGVELIGLGPTGMIFYITPTLQFILGYFYYNEEFSLVKFVSFIIIWIAVIVYLKDLYETN